jgi:hypothetical protein
VLSIAAPLYYSLENAIDYLSALQAFYLVALNIRDSKLYVTFIIEP